MRFLIFKLSWLLVVFAFLGMVPGLILLHVAGGWVVAGVFACAVVLSTGYLARRLMQEKIGLREMLFAETDMGWQLHPLITLLGGLIFAGAGFLVAVQSRGMAAPPPGSNQMTAAEQCWFGMTVLILGTGVAGLAVSQLLPDRSQK